MLYRDSVQRNELISVRSWNLKLKGIKCLIYGAHMTQQKIHCMAGCRNMLRSLDVMAYRILTDIYVCSCCICILRGTHNTVLSIYGTNIKAEIITGQREEECTTSEWK